MTESVMVEPVRDPWTVAIYAQPATLPPTRKLLGSGILIDADRVLTCDHVIAKYRGTPAVLVVAFRKANLVPALRVGVAEVVTAAPHVDAAVMRLVESVGQVAPAPVLCPEPANVVGHRWWAFGFPNENTFPNGNAASGRVGAVLADGYVRLDTKSRYVVEQGFSGAGLWSYRYQRVVGLVGQAQLGGAHPGDAAAISLFIVDRALPEAKLTVLAGWRVDAAGEVAHAAWGWSLATDVETGGHWDPRSRGVHQGDEHGFGFRGRQAALTRIAGRLGTPPGDRRVLVVTGSQGVGKSALLGRIVTSSDPDFRQRMPDDGQVCAPVGSVACAVHVKGKTAREVADEIARAVGTRLPDQLEDLAPTLYRWLKDRPGRACNLVLDALDEATTSTETRAIITEIAVPIAQQCAPVGAQVLVATRRLDHQGSLLQAFGTSASILDLDSPEYFEREDLAAYALATLQLVGDERPNNPYANLEVAAPVADRIAQVAQRNFLVAGLVARAHGLHDVTPVDPQQVVFPDNVATALRAYLRRLETGGRVWTVPAFTALAHAQAPGLTIRWWRLFLTAMGVTVSVDELEDFTRSAAANFLLESGAGGPEPVFRLFHQALNDTLLDTAQRATQHQTITEALIASGRRHRWRDTDDYLRRALPVHAAAAGLIDTLLTDDDYLIHADLLRLLPFADTATTPAGRERARMLRLTPGASEATPQQRVELFSVTTVLDRLGNPVASDLPVRYRGRWAVVNPRAEYAILHDHTDAVTGVYAVTVNGRTLLASASDDRTVRLWDPSTGRHERTLEGHTGGVNGVCAVTVNGRTLLASASDDQTVRLWDPATGRPAGPWNGIVQRMRRRPHRHTDWVWGVCAVTVNGRTLLASASDDQTVRLWDPSTGRHERTLEGHTDWVKGVCAVTVNGSTLLASASWDQTVRLWDPATGNLHTTIPAHSPANSCLALGNQLTVGLYSGILSIMCLM